MERGYNISILWTRKLFAATKTMYAIGKVVKNLLLFWGTLLYTQSKNLKKVVRRGVARNGAGKVSSDDSNDGGHVRFLKSSRPSHVSLHACMKTDMQIMILRLDFISSDDTVDNAESRR